MDATSQAQVMALVRYFVSEKQGTRILVMPYTQIRETRRKLDNMNHSITVLNVTRVGGHFRWLPGRKQDLRDMRALALTCKQYPCF
jgi:hypothetical protein